VLGGVDVHYLQFCQQFTGQRVYFNNALNIIAEELNP
jgi:hypothetical protein